MNARGSYYKYYIVKHDQAVMIHDTVKNYYKMGTFYKIDIKILIKTFIKTYFSSINLFQLLSSVTNNCFYKSTDTWQYSDI